MEAGGSVAVKEQRAGQRKPAVAKPVSHNLQGQRLGRKGRDTRERILAATRELLASSDEMTLSAVARRAGLGMTSLYVYFNDLTELLIAIMEPVMEEAETGYLQKLASEWPDAELYEHCRDFVYGFHGFWMRHAKILHLRNRIGDQGDRRMMAYRVEHMQPMIEQLVRQMGGNQISVGRPRTNMATILFMGLERVVTVATDDQFHKLLPSGFTSSVPGLLESQARALELAIRETRTLPIPPV